MVVHICNPSTQEAEAGLGAQGQPQIFSKTLSRTNKNLKGKKQKARNAQ
jgi:hypothetical protein